MILNVHRNVSKNSNVSYIIGSLMMIVVFVFASLIVLISILCCSSAYVKASFNVLKYRLLHLNQLL